MPHQGLANFLHHPRFHEPRVERVAEVMEAAVADARAADSGLPSGLNDPNGLAVESKEQTLVLPQSEKQGMNPFRERDLSPLAACGL